MTSRIDLLVPSVWYLHTDYCQFFAVSSFCIYFIDQFYLRKIKDLKKKIFISYHCNICIKAYNY